MNSQKGTGGKKDPLGLRAPPVDMTEMPMHEDVTKLRSYKIFDAGIKPVVYNQGNINSCSANAVAAAYNYDLQRSKNEHADFEPSRLFLYYVVRYMELNRSEDDIAKLTSSDYEKVRAQPPTTPLTKDDGARVSDIVRVMAYIGAPWDQKQGQTDYPYKESKVHDPPPEPCYRDAVNHMSPRISLAANDVICWKRCIRAGYPIIFYFECYDACHPKIPLTDAPWIIPTPTGYKRDGKTPDESEGHIVLAVGWDDDIAGGCFLVQNSWGATWANKGFCWMPYSWLEGPVSVNGVDTDLVQEGCWTLWRPTKTGS